MAESKRRRIESSFLSQLNQEEKRIISSEIAQDYRKLARRLTFKESEINNIQHECDANGRKNPEEYCMEIITQWEQREGTRASKEMMKQALTYILRKDIVEQLCNERDVIPDIHEEEQLRAEKETQKKLESAQLRRYRELEMKIAPWMTDTYLPLEKLYVALQMFSANKLGNEDKGVLIDIDEIFNPTKRHTLPLRILVEGDAGFGKTTLLNKLVDDWTKKQYYIYSRFRNVFLFYLREFNNNQTFEDFIRIGCNDLNVNEEKGLKCIKAFEKETLFLLDGYDELSKDCKPKFENLLLGNEFEYATIIVTSRRGEFQKENTKKIDTGLTAMHRTCKDHIHIWDKRILIAGISPENRLMFLQKYFQTENPKESLEQHFHIADKELFRCPLFLILLATVKNEENVQMIETQTDFYKFLLNVVTRRSLVRIHMLDENENLELFDCNHENYHEECAKQMVLFGSLAIQHLIKDDLTFTQKELEECCGKDAIFSRLGFISRRTTYKNWNRKNYFEPFHKSFLEFFAAFNLYCLATNSEESNQEEFKKRISDLYHANIHPYGMSLIYLFLAGLLNTGCSLLFHALSSCGISCNIFKKSFMAILVETKNPETFISSLKPYIPDVLHIDDILDLYSNYQDIVRILLHELFSSSFKFQSVIVDDYWFASQIRTEYLKFYISENSFDESYFLMERDNISIIECNTLLVEFLHCETNIWQNAIQNFHKIKFESFEINLLNSTDLIQLLHKELTQGSWKNFDIDKLTIEEDEILLQNTPKTYFCLSDLMQNKRIKNIKLDTYISETQAAKEETFHFLDWKCLNKIHIFMSWGCMFKPIFSNSIILWNFWGNGKQCNFSLNDSSFCVDKIEFESHLNDKSIKFVMKHCTGVTTLICDAQFLGIYCSEQSFPNLQELELEFHTDQHFDLSKLLVFPQLRLLKILMRWHLNFNYLYKNYIDENSCFVKSWTSIVCHPKLEILVLEFEAEILLIILQNLYNTGIEKQEISKTKLLSTDSERNIQKKIESLVIDFYRIHESKTIYLNEIMTLIKLLLKRNFVKEIILRNNKYDNKHDFIRSLLVSFPTEGFICRDSTDKYKKINYKCLIISFPNSKLNYTLASPF